jgi:ATP-dependent RNA helicase RhlE
MPPEIRKLSTEWLRNPTYVEVAPVATPAELVEHSVHFVEPRDKLSKLQHFLENTAYTRTLVFSRTKRGADKIVKQLTKSGIRAAALHSNKSQSVRQRTLEQFKGNRPPVLVATDIAARGLDVDAISHVVNFDLPEVPEVYVHRIGRTGRAGATGDAVSLVCIDEADLLRGVQRLLQVAIPWQTEPGFVPRRDAEPQPLRTPRGASGGGYSSGGGAPRRGGSTPRTTRRRSGVA